MTKRIVFDRTTRDYVAELDGEIVGFFKTWQEASDHLDLLVYLRLTHNGGGTWAGREVA